MILFSLLIYVFLYILVSKVMILYYKKQAGG